MLMHWDDLEAAQTNCFFTGGVYWFTLRKILARVPTLARTSTPLPRLHPKLRISMFPAFILGLGCRAPGLAAWLTNMEGKTLLLHTKMCWVLNDSITHFLRVAPTTGVLLELSKEGQAQQHHQQQRPAVVSRGAEQEVRWEWWWGGVG